MPLSVTSFCGTGIKNSSSKAERRLVDAESQQVEDLKEALHEAGARNGILVLEVERLKAEIMSGLANQGAYDLRLVKDILAEKDAEIARLKAENDKWVKESFKTLKEIERLKALLEAAK
jgi:uncharacterized small protein (DUF1192 family)